MFDRVAYKKTARKQLKGRWLLPIIMIIITLFLSSMFGMPTNAIDGAPGIAGKEGSAYTILSIIALFAEGVLWIANCFVFLRLARTTEKVSFGTFLTGLEQWLSGGLGMLWYTLWVFLWSLLFIIPGIIKSIAYSQMFFILAENPGIGVRKAMRISKIITQGYKGELFVMALSFLGWGFLCLLSCGIGFLWLIPYMQMSYANAYFGLKNMAIMTNKISPADFAPAN